MRDFYYVLYTTLLANCPVDSRNMVDNLEMDDMGDYWLITISGPRGDYDYAEKVNEQIIPTQSGPNKGRDNFMWIERTIEQVAGLFGIVPRYEVKYGL
jgi:hypothetical protein